ncbi:quinone-dependent dihydroorotate dehydrogenase [Nitrosophilus alvini]|uniref:quinone-dependent dihydroorotate dehydrogenase n=1 Tax=Nitrosophilus alvini TaxID=2714855 RepID=UPI00190D5FEF|nr:quinone-dependent dihydroorotate dehydrogenase [Nitrosophilus alvini]
MFEYEKIKNIIFKLDPETAHHIVECSLRAADMLPVLFNPFIEKNFVDDERLGQNILGKTFYNPIGLAAGFDKNGTMIRPMLALGFGFTEIGTVTPRPQSGNPKPRLFRYPQFESIQNAMGFNNDGMYKVQQRLKKRFPFVTPVGVNIGKNKITPEKEALNDYEQLIKGFKELCDYMVINISSPNTPGLRDLQNEEFINALFNMAKDITDTPILLKIAPDMEKSQAIDLTSMAVEAGADGIIATNTTVDYSLLPDSKDFGGISGKVLKEKSFEIFQAIAKELFGKTVLISVGGIDSAEEAYKRLKAGASAVQIYSALIFKGPGLVKEINEGLLKLMEKEGYTHISEVIGSDLKSSANQSSHTSL